MRRFQLADHPAGISHSQTVGRYVFGDHAAGSDDTAFTDGHSGQDDGAGADPYVVADADGMGVFQALCPLPDVHGVLFRDNAHIRRHEHMVSDGDFSAVHQTAVDIQKYMVSQGGVVPLGAEKRLFHRAVLPYAAQKLFDGSLPRAAVQRMDLVVFIKFLYGNIPVCGKLRVCGLIQEPGIRFFPFCHGYASF